MTARSRLTSVVSRGPDVFDAGFLFGLVAAVISVATLGLQWLERRSVVRRDEITYLQRQVSDLQRANELCEMRCEELREEMLGLLARDAGGGKGRRKRAPAG